MIVSRGEVDYLETRIFRMKAFLWFTSKPRWKSPLLRSVLFYMRLREIAARGRR